MLLLPLPVQTDSNWSSYPEVQPIWKENAHYGQAIKILDASSFCFKNKVWITYVTNHNEAVNQ